MAPVSFSAGSWRVALLGASAFMLYGAGRLIMGSVPARADRPTVRALLGVAIVLALALVAIVMDRPDIALHLPIACAMASMTFGVASLIIGRQMPAGRVGNSSWALVAPAVAIATIGGFGGRLDAMLLIALVGYGVAAMRGWNEPADPEVDSPAVGRAGIGLTVFWLGAVALAALAGLLLILGLPALESTGIRGDPLAVSFLLAPAIVVPIFFELLPPCRSLRWNGSMSVLAKFALLNLCFVLPIAALVQADAGVIRELWQSRIAAVTLSANSTSNASASQPTSMPAASMPTTRSEDASEPAGSRLSFPQLPAVALRVDLPVLAGAMLLLIPLAAGWQRAGMLEAGALLLSYLVALLLMLFNGWKR